METTTELILNELVEDEYGEYLLEEIEKPVNHEEKEEAKNETE